MLKAAQSESMHGYDIWVIELIVPAKQALMLQAWLLAEDGLGVIRCRDPEKKKQQLWTTVHQLEEAHAWLKSLPVTVVVNTEWLWSESDE
ncbi:MAG: DUF4911 domain-containing protein [Mariprofundaceae bacterium]